MGDKGFRFGLGREPFLRAGCPFNTCMTTGDQELFPARDLDAVVWHFRSVDRSLPTQRSAHTRYVFWMLESAQHPYGNVNTYNGIFNWTFTNRRDSDLYNPYGRVVKRIKPQTNRSPDYNFADNKTKMAAWFVSNCKSTSGRERLVKEMQNYLSVDIYGTCGPLKCEKAVPFHQVPTCLLRLQNEYKFYLSFENSLCEDYVTEKFFDTLRYDVVPVVYGLGNYKDIAPPHSYIDVFDFPSIKALTDYLIYLNSNDTAYNEYFRWKPYFLNEFGWLFNARPWCKLCELLHTNNSTKIYQDLHDWFVTQSHCKSQDIINPLLNGANLETQMPSQSH